MPAEALAGLGVCVEPGEEGCRAKSQRRGGVQVAREGRSSKTVGAAANRPTPAEEQEARDVIQQMKDADPPLLAKRAPAKPNVVACAIALWRGEQFANDRAALELFNAHPETKIRGVWVAKLDEFAPAGFATPGPAMPTYLLDRDEPIPSSADARFSSSRESSSGGEDDSEDDERRLQRRVDRWSCNVAAQDRRWQCEQDEEKSRRAREAAKRDAAHGAECEAQHAALAAEQPDFYWALACEIGQRPKWQLRRGECLEPDATRIVADDEALLLYRSFRPFRADGDLMKAAQVFAGSPDYAWLDAERTRLEPTPAAAEPCVRLEELSSSDDCHYLGVHNDERLQQAVRVDGDPHELEPDRVLAEHGRIARIHGRPWDEVPQGSTAPAHWLDSTDEGGPVDRPWERAERAKREHEERELRDRLERMARANIPPPRREDERYGPLAGNREGDEAFRMDRAVWYENVTGDSLVELSLTDQWERVDVVARRFREYSDGRPVRPREEMPTAPTPPPPPPAPPLPSPPLPRPPPPTTTLQPVLGSHAWKRELKLLSDSELAVMQQMMQQSAQEAQQQIQQIREHEQPGLPFDRALWARKDIERERERFEMAQFHIEDEVRNRRS